MSPHDNLLRRTRIILPGIRHNALDVGTLTSDSDPESYCTEPERQFTVGNWAFSLVDVEEEMILLLRLDIPARLCS
ncbi:hypothetical protein H9L39_05197 [Fusarium oxysporum f. sp. albedinis]|nr:hypothetical protein H9L39_05197 [Fusarium oxysporum f. sp. albedinis]